MSKRIGRLVALSVTAVFVAVIAATATGPGPAQAQTAENLGWCVFQDANGDVAFAAVSAEDVPLGSGHEEFCEDEYDGAFLTDGEKNLMEDAKGETAASIFGATNLGWCAKESPSGQLEFVKITSDDPGLNKLSGRSAREEFCDEHHDGAFMKNKQKERMEGTGGPGLLPLTSPQDFPKKDWFGSPQECKALPNSGAIIGGEAANQNRLQHVNVLRSIELGLQIAYDVGSNEITGITGAILGGLLGAAKVSTYITEWNYDLQDECQEILERRQIADLSVDTKKVVSDVQTILARVDVAVSTRATQTSVDDVDAKVMQISTTLGNLATSLTDETDEIDAALAALAASLTAETDEIDAALAGLKGQLVAGQDQSVRLFIEDHLERCRPLGSLLLSDSAGLLPLTVLVVEDLAARAEAAGLAIGNARLHLDRANDSILAGDARGGFQSLCTAYEQIVRGRGG